HFEKMLYDNAQLLRTYADAWRLTREARHARTAREIAAYVAREMTAPGGGFFATQDADSEGEEGKFFVWTPAEIDAACAGDAEAAAMARAYFDVTGAGNFEASGATVLSTPASIEEAAARASVPVAAAGDAVERARGKLFDAREKRPRPFRDEKILASWNGLMAGALASAGAAFADCGMVEAAARALSFVEEKLVVREGSGARVLRHAKGDVVKGPGFLDDHAYVGDAALDLYGATGDPRWVALARALADTILARFHDAEGGGFFLSPDDGEKLLVRAKDAFDHAVPSGAAVACRLLLRLGTLCDERYSAPAERTLEGLAHAAAQTPMGMSVTVGLIDRLARGSTDVVVVGARSSEKTRALAAAAQRAFVPDLVLAWADPADPATLDACAPLARDKPAQAEPVAYVCRGRTCSRPLRDPEELERDLAGR
ncbi:MAG: thioredoxin domain-containing protein, partial [Polyangiaceae bacterium]